MTFIKKNHYLLFAVLIAVAMSFTACLTGDDDEKEADNVTITLTGNPDTVLAGASTAFSGIIDANVPLTGLTFGISAVDTTIPAAEVAKVTAAAKNVLLPDTKTWDLRTDADLLVSSYANSCNGTYRLTVNATAGIAANSGIFDFTIKNGTGCISTSKLLTEKTGGIINNIAGPDTGAYDLMAQERVAANGLDAKKDLVDMSVAGAGFSLSLRSANGGTFVKAPGFDYANASDESAEAAFAAGPIVTQVTNITAGEIIIIKIRGTENYAVIQILTATLTGGSGTSNLGQITFNWKI
ncbi:MAG: hypothetical protein HQK83_12435 [Fibrobacteria bacterium]|nr:hypothetical protein [Fibrobacteria bacterium]